MRINLKIPEEWNEDRKKLNATWRAVIKAGLTALQGQSLNSEGIPPVVEDHLKRALNGLSATWKLIKPLIKNR
jgi:hypothetical protein